MKINKIIFDEITLLKLYQEIHQSFSNEITMLFESVYNSDNFSFITIGSYERVQYQNNQTIYTNHNNLKKKINEDPITFLQNYYKKIDKNLYENLSQEYGFSFIDGFIGFIGYDIVQIFEPTLIENMKNLKDELNIPDLDFVRPDIILAFSHKYSTLTIIKNGNSINLEKLNNIFSKNIETKKIKKTIFKNDGNFNIDEKNFKKLILESQEMIKQGDIFQILLSNRYSRYGKVDPISFYRVLKSKNPSPYLFLLTFEDFSICGSSPEMMTSLVNNEISLFPIAGTRPRGKNKKLDDELELEMKNDEKECAEHLMLIDLGRNDLGRISKSGTVKVQDIMHTKKFSHVMHMETYIKSIIEDDKDMFDLLRATFTAGTMTGAPKVRAMELIGQYEKVKRSFYSGLVGYFSFNGDMDSAITIRTALINESAIYLHAGCGVVADSKANLEYLEVQNKLKVLIETIKFLEK